MSKIKLQKDINVNNYISHSTYPCVSLFIDNNDTWPQNKVAMKTLKSQLKDVKKELNSESFELVKDHFDNLKEWTEDAGLWKDVKGSIIVYFSNSELHFHEVDMKLTTSFHIGHFYDIRPLLSLNLQTENEFFLLRCSQKEASCFLATPFNFHKIEIKGIPDSIKDISKYDEAEKTLQSHSYRDAPNSSTAIMHGHGLPSDHKKDLVKEYGKLIGKGMLSVLKKHPKVPLILMGVSPLVDFVKESLECQHTYLIHKNPDEFSDQHIISDGRKIILNNAFELEEARTANFLKNFESSAKSVKKIPEIIKYAFEGRVDELYIKKEDYLWGKFNVGKNSIPQINHFQDQSEDLLNVASIYTLQNGGRVHLFDPEKHTCQEHAIALLR